MTATAELLAPERVGIALVRATGALLDELRPHRHWRGELSSSALATATAVVALKTVDPVAHAERIARGMQWLADHANADGGWGDTAISKSNISTTALVWAAAGSREETNQVKTRAAEWLAKNLRSTGQGFSDADLARRIEQRYGKDRTFAAPILMMCAVTGAMTDGWRYVPALPFELAALPHRLYGALRLPVVSYALPALIAIGQATHHHAPSRFGPWRSVRAAVRARTLRVLAAIQPANGGFLEATPLTSFVTMALASTGLRDHVVVARGVEFLVASQREDGSWPIDTNLATWVTTLAVKALSQQHAWGSPETRNRLREWLLAQQYRTEHPYTHAAPGGWAWTDLPGGVPDADDTAGALLAILKLGAVTAEVRHAAAGGVRWLLGLQNRDGGIPTFCRGWGALPFDRSSPDLTAHALRAWSAWLPQLTGEVHDRVLRGIDRALGFLSRSQRTDGAWLPLWFGNEHAPDDENLTYGTAKVLIALRELRDRGFTVSPDVEKAAARWLVGAQREDGGWSGVPGGPASVEETALATEALSGLRGEAAERGARWLVERVESGAWREAAPIGFYFAKLWYYERLYPLIFTVGALGKFAGVRADASVPPLP